MANEISTQVKTSLTNPTSSSLSALLKAVFDPGAFTLNQTTQAAFGDTVTVGTSEQDLALPTNSAFTASNQGIWCAINLDPTNFVKFGPKSGGAMIEFGRLYPKIPQQIQVAPSVVIRWVADTAPCKVLFLWLAK